MLSIIVAVSKEGVIGVNGSLPWHLPADLAHFKRVTMGKPMIMGRKTLESLPGLLPGRRHVVLSRNPTFHAEGCTVVVDPITAIKEAGPASEIMIIGGASIYAQFLPVVNKIYLTEVNASVLGQFKFPSIDLDEWRIESRETCFSDAINKHSMTFLELSRKSNFVTSEVYFVKET